MSLKKFIVKGNDKVKANNAAMGEKVNYRLETVTSKMDGYESPYTYIIHDELDEGSDLPIRMSVVKTVKMPTSTRTRSMLRKT